MNQIEVETRPSPGTPPMTRISVLLNTHDDDNNVMGTCILARNEYGVFALCATRDDPGGNVYTGQLALVRARGTVKVLITNSGDLGFVLMDMLGLLQSDRHMRYLLNN